MMRIKIISPGKTKEPWLLEALAEYEKRLSVKAKIEWIFPKELSPIETPYALLDVKGSLLSSEDFSKYLMSKTNHTFVIGGAEGPPLEIKEKASFKFSLSNMTFTHQMVRLILLEQIYRGFEIHKGSKYHK